MRQIKFRGRVVKGYNEDFFKGKGGWVYGNAIIVEDEIESTIINSEFEAQVDTNTIGQFTGIINNNKKEIYEGDILAHPSIGDGSRGIGYVKWDEEHAGWIVDDGGTDDDVWYESFDFAEAVIIGNIHDNPELLKQ